MTREPAKSGYRRMSGSYEEYFEREITMLRDVFKSGNEGALYEVIIMCLEERRLRADGAFQVALCLLQVTLHGVQAPELRQGHRLLRFQLDGPLERLNRRCQTSHPG